MTLIRKHSAIILSLVVAIVTTIALVFGSGGTAPSARLLHTEPSEFAPVVVFEQYGERCMNFVAIDAKGRQTCFQLNDPDKMVFEYTRMMTSALFAKPDPKTVLIIGLGGATLPIALHKILPDAMIDSVEIDPAVAQVAQDYFGYEPGPRQRVFIEDGREFVERAHREGRQYDIVMLDAFDIDYIPAHLLTLEFLQHVHDILAPGGVVVANSFARSTMYDRETATYAAVFGDFYNLRARLDGNRVIVAGAGALPDTDELQRNAEGLAERLKAFGIDADVALARFSMQRKQEQKAEPLRDVL